MAQVDDEIKSTRNWGMAILLAILIPSVGGFIWVGSIDSRVDQNKENIVKLDNKINSIDSDIRAILVGIEQVKARLGIIEDGR